MPEICLLTIVCMWPLKSSGLSLHGGVASSHMESKSDRVPSFLVKAKGFVECVNVIFALPSHSIFMLVV